MAWERLKGRERRVNREKGHKRWGRRGGKRMEREKGENREGREREKGDDGERKTGKKEHNQAYSVPA